MSLETEIATLAENIGVDVRGLRNGKVDKVDGKGLSDSNFTQAEKDKLADISTEATKNRDDALNADKVHTHTTAQVTGLDAALGDKVGITDPRLTNAREWSAATVTQTEAEAGTASTRRAWTAQRVRQAVNAWWQLVTSGFGRNFIAASNEQAARNVLQLGTTATGNTVQEEGSSQTDVMSQKAVTDAINTATPAFLPISWHVQSIESSVTIPNDVNAWSFGPTMTIAEGQTVTVGEGSFWTVANGEIQ